MSQIGVVAGPAGDGPTPPGAVKGEPPAAWQGGEGAEANGAADTPVKVEVPKDQIRFPEVPGTTLSLRLLDGARARRARALPTPHRVYPRLFPGRTRDLAAFPPKIRGPLTERSPAPIRPDADFEIRDKRDEGKMVGLETSRVANVVVFGKARKVVGGEHDRPHEVLSGSKAMTPLDKPPHPLKLSEVLDWTVSYAEPPCVWLVTLRAWYRLGNPSPAYLRTFAGIQRRTRLVRAVADALRVDFDLSCDAALDAMAACDVVEGDLLDPKFRGAHAANVAAREAARAEAEKAARDDGATGAAIRAAGDAAERTAEQTPLRYTRRMVMEDAAFVAAQIEGLRRSGGLVPGDRLARPACVVDLASVLAKTRKEEAVAERRARSNGARAAAQARRAARTGERQARRRGRAHQHQQAPVADGEGEARDGGSSTARTPHRAAAPRGGRRPGYVRRPARAHQRDAHAVGPDADPRRVPQAPALPVVAIRSSVSGTETGRNRTIRDGRRVDSRVGGPALRRGAGSRRVRRARQGRGGVRSRRRRRAETCRPATCKSVSKLEEPDDLRMLDWAERVGVVLSLYSQGIDGGHPGNAWPSEAVRVGATAAAEALSKSATGDERRGGVPATTGGAGRPRRGARVRRVR